MMKASSILFALLASATYAAHRGRIGLHKDLKETAVYDTNFFYLFFFVLSCHDFSAVFDFMSLLLMFFGLHRYFKTTHMLTINTSSKLMFTITNINHNPQERTSASGNLTSSKDNPTISSTPPFQSVDSGGINTPYVPRKTLTHV